MVSLPVLNLQTQPSAPPRSVRLSLTDRCDLACIYCRPSRSDGYLEKRLDLEAWSTLLAGLVRAGVRRVRITGGEPLLHPKLVDFVKQLGTLGLSDVALTTNATRLGDLALPLRRAGLHRINISIDTLDEARFRRMTRGGDLKTVLAGIEAARSAGFDEIKTNTVVVRGENDDELESITRWAWQKGLVPRFLEVMAIGEGAHLQDRVVTGAEMLARLGELLVSEDRPQAEVDRGPARYVRARHDGALRVGFITGTSDTYCAGCDRLRVASDGILRPCLARNDGLSAADAARKGDAVMVERLVDAAWKTMKPDGESWKGCTEASAAEVSIRAIGG